MLQRRFERTDDEDAVAATYWYQTEMQIRQQKKAARNKERIETTGAPSHEGVRADMPGEALTPADAEARAPPRAAP